MSHTYIFFCLFFRLKTILSVFTQHATFLNKGNHNYLPKLEQSQALFIIDMLFGRQS